MTIRDGRSRKEPKGFRDLRPEDIGAAPLGPGGMKPVYLMPALGRSQHLIGGTTLLSADTAAYVPRYVEVLSGAELIIGAGADLEVG